MRPVQQSVTKNSMLPAKMRRHHDTNHPEYKEEDISCFP
jgi:hypothetical protein